MTLRAELACIPVLFALALLACPAQAGSVVPGSAIPQMPIAPGLSQDCVHKLDPTLRGAAANRAARACRHPSGPPYPVAATAPAAASPSPPATAVPEAPAPASAEPPKP